MITIKNKFGKNGNLATTIHLKEDEIYSVGSKTVPENALFSAIYAICIVFQALVTKEGDNTIIEGTMLKFYFKNIIERSEVYEKIKNKMIERNIDTELVIILDNNHFVEIRESKELPKEPLSFNIGVSQ